MNLDELLNIYRPYRTLIYLIETQASASAATWAMILRPFRPWPQSVAMALLARDNPQLAAVPQVQSTTLEEAVSITLKLPATFVQRNEA